jgi:transcriptional regulator of acetoin/glycerol metabolism
MDRIARGTEQPTLVQPSEPLLINTRASSAAEEISDSWRRCVVDYRIDPRSRTVPNIITQGKLKVFREPLADVIVHAREEIDRLCAIVRQQAYVVLLCNDDGVAIHHRGDEARAEEFKRTSTC